MVTEEKNRGIPQMRSSQVRICVLVIIRMTPTSAAFRGQKDTATGPQVSWPGDLFVPTRSLASNPVFWDFRIHEALGVSVAP